MSGKKGRGGGDGEEEQMKEGGGGERGVAFQTAKVSSWIGITHERYQVSGLRGVEWMRWDGVGAAQTAEGSPCSGITHERY